MGCWSNVMRNSHYSNTPALRFILQKTHGLCRRIDLCGIFNVVSYRTSAFGFRQQMVNLGWLTRCIQLLQNRGAKLEIRTYYRFGLSHCGYFGSKFTLHIPIILRKVLAVILVLIALRLFMLKQTAKNFLYT